MSLKSHHQVKAKCPHTWGWLTFEHFRPLVPIVGMWGGHSGPEACRRKALDFVLLLKGKLSSPATDKWGVVSWLNLSGKKLHLASGDATPTPIVFVLVL